MNNKNDFDFIFEHINELDKNITLPDSLKSENLLKLIDDIEPVAASPVAEKKVVHFFNRKGFAIAAMLVVAIGITVLYKSGNLFLGTDEMKTESSPAPMASEIPTDDYTGNTEKSQSPTPNRSEKFMEESFVMDSEESSQIMDTQDEPTFHKASLQKWYTEENKLILNGETIYTFPEGFEFSDSYSEGNLLIINGVLSETNQSIITVFKQEQNEPPQFLESIVNQGKTIYTMVYGDLTIIISTENGSTFVNTYKGATKQESTEIEHNSSTKDIFDSNSGFAIKLSDTSALIFDNNGQLIRDIQIDEGLSFSNIIVEGNLAYLFLNNEETLTVPLTK